METAAHNLAQMKLDSLALDLLQSVRNARTESKKEQSNVTMAIPMPMTVVLLV